jgi:hypothetical protein
MRSVMFKSQRLDRTEDAVAPRNRHPPPDARTMMGLARRMDRRRQASGGF